MNDSPKDLIDWRAEWLASRSCESVALLVPVGGELMDDEVDELYARVQVELREIIEEPELGTATVDPYTGAGGYGIGAVWEIIGHGADLLAWVGAAAFAAKKIRTAAQFLARRVGGSKSAEVYLSGEAIKALCVAELCEAGIPPETIERVTLVEHKYPPLEPTVEKQQFFSAYTVTVEGRQADHFFHVWNFFVTCRGEVVSKGSVRIPMPNASQWSQTLLPTQKLHGLP